MANAKNKKTSMEKSVKATPVAAAQAAVATGSAIKVGGVAGTVANSKPVTPVKTAVEAKPAAKPVAKEPVKKPITNKAAEKTTAKKTVAKKAVKKPVEVVQEVYFEYMGEQILSAELVERIKETYKNEGHRISSIKSLRVYVNPEERKAYYVINDKAEGKFVEF